MSKPIILASQSAGRQSMLTSVGLDFTSVPADIDEPALMEKFMNQRFAPSAIALELAHAKAFDVARDNPDALVIGSDQVLEFEGKMLSKAQIWDGAIHKLQALRGKAHKLVSAVCVVSGENVVWECIDEATLKMHDFDDAFLQNYADNAGEEALLGCVGAYQIEREGAWLFEKIEGNHFTIMGMPLIPLLNFLRKTQGAGP